MNITVCRKIEKQDENVKFLCGNELSYAYFKKRLYSLVIINSDSSADKNLDIFKIPSGNIAKYQQISKAKCIPVFIIIHNENLNCSLSIKIIDKNGEICCPHKKTKRQEKAINYIFDISKNKTFKQYASI